MTTIDIGFAAGGLFLAGIIKGVTGLGYSSCALPFLVTALGLRDAIVVVIIPAMMSNLLVMIRTGHFQETLSRFWLLYLATLPGIAVGISVLVWIDQRRAAQVLGLLTVAYALLALARPMLALRPNLERPLQIPVGLANGFFTGLTGSQMMPLLPYMLSLQLDAERLVQANNMLVTFSSAIMLVGFALSGLMSIRTLAMSILAILPALVGVHIGTLTRPRLPADGFRRIVLGLLLVIGGTLAVGN